jgi:hypothetical protein
MGGALAAALVAIVIALAGNGSSGERRPEDAGAVPVYRMDADHATYPTVGGVKADADTVLVGNVLSESTEAGQSPGDDALGDPLPAVPHTNYVVKVSSSLKGGLAEGATILVSLTGGTTPEGEFVLDGAPEISVGNTYLFFLQSSADRYYPLAGGAAIASDRGDGTFELPTDATGGEPLVLTEAELRERAPSSSPAPGPLPAARMVLTVRLVPHQRLASALANGLKVKVTCSAACRLDGKLGEEVKSRAARGVRKIVGAGRANKGGILVLHFTQRSQRRLEGAKSVRLSLSVKATGPGGSVASIERGVRLAPRSALLTARHPS